MTHSLLETRQKMRDEQIGMIPGMSKLQTKITGHSPDKMVTEIEVNRSKGILIRHHLLGIHGRHKNPFREMKIFGTVNYYQNREIWKEAEQIFSVQPWRALRDKLIELMGTRVLSARPNSTSYLKMKVNEPEFKELIRELQPLYFACLQPSVFRTQPLVRFWEARLGLLEGTAYLLYSELKKNVSKLNDNEWPDYTSIIKSAEQKETNKEGTQLKAICAIEPLLACFEKVSNRLLARRTATVNELISFIDNWRTSSTISVNIIQPFLREDFMNESALQRLKELLHIFSSSSNSRDFILKIIDYHKKIMNERGVLPWISISNDGEIKHHRPYYFTTDQLARLAFEEWVNAYYLPTVFRLYKGLYTN
ncbi:MAG: hypothetical protein IPO83_18205 [Chitinophagaceae bacterium]|nr:hypothetical protein [Chitinophagaceae bacterium]